MSTKAKRAGKIAGKTMGMIVFAILFAFNIQVAFSDDASEELNFLGVKISLFNDITGKPVQADDDDGGGGGGGSGGLGHFVATRTDVWHCYKLTQKTIYVAGLPLGVYCIDENIISVNTEVCYSGGGSCAPGTWRWNPNPPCSGSWSSNYPSGYGPC